MNKKDIVKAMRQKVRAQLASRPADRLAIRSTTSSAGAGDTEDERAAENPDVQGLPKSGARRIRTADLLGGIRVGKFSPAALEVLH
jgi:hypothetical protein